MEVSDAHDVCVCFPFRQLVGGLRRRQKDNDDGAVMDVYCAVGVRRGGGFCFPSLSLLPAFGQGEAE